MENFKKEKVSLWRRIAALALAAALALGLAACDASAVVPGSSTPTVSTAQPAGDGQTANFEMHFLDVGQALSVLVECDGQYMLYDGGNVDDGSYVVSYLQNLGVEELQYVFCSHAHEDHVGGLAAALAYFPADHVYSPVTEASTKCFQDFVKYTQQQGLQVEVPAAGTVWPLGSATVTMLGPVAQYDNTNDTSIVLRVDYGSTSFLLTGDMESDAERDLVNSGANLKADVLQVGHHGSSTSTSYIFLNAVLPEMGIISCGVNNKYGHPHEETLSILRDAGVDVYRTDLLGAIVIGSDGQNYTIRTEKTATDAELNHRPGGSVHRAAGVYRQREQQKVPPAQLCQPPCGEEPDPLLQLRGGHCGRVQPVLELHQVKSISNKQRPAGVNRQGAAVFWDHFFRFLKSTGSVVHRFRKRYAASLGWRWRVNRPFLLPSTRRMPSVVWKSAKFHTSSPCTKS